MAVTTILSATQTKLLEQLSMDKMVYTHFYLSGGTALAEFYLCHRLSEDLDFFSETEVDPQSIFVLFKKLHPVLHIKKIDFQQSFNRNLFFITIGQEVIKTEFTYFPFAPINKKRIRHNQLAIDSLFDIAVNKIFTIYQKPRSRDFIDLYCILKQEKWTIEELVKQAKIKFDWHVDSLQLGTQFNQALVLKDFPHLIKKITPARWQNFFLTEAKKLKKEIFT